MTGHSYFVVMISYPRRVNGVGAIVPASSEAIANPEITKRGVVARIRSGEYPRDRIEFIHHVDGMFIEDVTADLFAEATPLWQAAE